MVALSTNLLILLINYVTYVVSYDQYLRRESITYAISTLANDQLNQNSSLCTKHLSILARATEEKRLWARKMLDSSGRPRSGFLWGHNFWLGAASQCAETTNHQPLILSKKIPSRHNITEYEYPPYPVNFFVAYFRHNFTQQEHVRLPNEDLIELGLCLPYVCKTGELLQLLQQFFDERTLSIQDFYKIDFKMDYVKDTKDDPRWLLSARFIIMLLLLLFTLTLTTIGTVYDVTVYQPHLKLKKKALKSKTDNIIKQDELESGANETNGATKQTKLMYKFKQQTIVHDECQYRPTVLNRVILCFSLYTNCKIILDTRLSSDSVPAVHGIRLGGMMWIIMVHTVYYLADYTDNRPMAFRTGTGFAVQVISNSLLSVDTFFFLSGFLVSYLFYNSKKGKLEKRPINYAAKWMELLLVTVRRYVRLTPAYLVALSIITVNYTWYANVSSFHQSERADILCSKYWWRNILYINNLYPRNEMCLSWSWYLSNDMQFFIIASFLMILSTVFFKTAYCIILFLITASCIITGYISYSYNYIPTLDEQYNMLNYLYDPPWTRIGPYLIGVITGYVVVKLNGKLLLKKRTLVLGWIIGPFLNLSMLFALYDRTIPVESAAIYMAISRTVWGIGLAWLVIACCTNHAGFINKILSFKGFVPLSRMTYCAYLLNPWLINSIYADSEFSKHVEFVSLAVYYMGFFMITYICAFVFSVLFESPSVLLMRIIINARDSKIEKNKKNFENPS